MHEFQLIDNGDSALVTAYSVEPFDGTELNLTNGLSWLLNCHVREIDTSTGRINFDWSARDHFDPNVVLLSNEFYRSNRRGAIDFFHLNSVAKSNNGDYVISARHMDAVYKISHQDGHVIWQLGGRNSTIEANFALCHQHHVRILDELDGNMTLSIFNNGCETNASTTASAMVVNLDQIAKTATLVQEFRPENAMTVGSQGSVSIDAESGNAVVGWGLESTITEHSANGTIIFNATLGGGVAQSYRAFKAEWHGFPRGRPKVWVYAKTPEARTVIYVSWNGATEVAHWRFHGRNRSSEMKVLGSIAKFGFETDFASEEHVDFAFAEAVSREGASLRNSSIQEVFIPSPELVNYCSDYICRVDARNEYLLAQYDAKTKAKQLLFEGSAIWSHLLIVLTGIIFVGILCTRARACLNSGATQKCLRSRYWIQMWKSMGAGYVAAPSTELWAEDNPLNLK